MSATAQVTHHSRLFGGLNTTTPPYLLSEEQLTVMAEMRTRRGVLEQSPGFVKNYTRSSPIVPSVLTCQGLVALPSLYGYGLNLLLTPYGPISWETTPFRIGYVPVDGVTTYPTYSFAAEYGIAWAVYGGRIWYTAHGPLSIGEEPRGLVLHSTDGCLLQKHEGCPSGTYLDTFFDHLFIGGTEYQGEYYPWRLQWSDLRNFTEWGPTATNEADFYDFDEWAEGEDVFAGLTGIRKVGDTLLVFTPSAVLGVKYVGLPKIVQVVDIPGAGGVGNTLPYTMAGYRHLTFFLDLGSRNFYLMEGTNPPVAIGDPVVATLEAELESILTYTFQPRAFAVPRRSEVWWWLPSGTTLIFNWEEKKWMSRFMQGVVPFGFAPTLKGATRASNSGISTVKANDSSIAASDSYGLVTPIDTGLTLFGTGYSTLYSEDTLTGSPSASLVVEDSPKVETGDITMGDLEAEKEMASVSLQASWTTGDGIEVSLSARNQLDEAVTYTVMGTWNPSLPEGKLSFAQRKMGRIFRWRFKLLGSNPRGLKIRSFTETWYGTSSVKR